MKIKIIGAFSILVTLMAAAFSSTASFLFMHQPKTPKSLK